MNAPDVGPPGPRSLSIRQAVEFGRDPNAYMARCHAEYGDTFTLRLPRDPVRVVVCAPQDVRKVFALGPTDYRSDDQSLQLNVGQRSVLFADGDRHRRKRQLLAPPMHSARLKSYAEAMLRITDERIDELEVGAEFTGYSLFRAITLDIILETIFGVHPASERGQRLSDQLCAWLESALSPGMLALGLAITGNRLRRWLDDATQSARDGGGPVARLPWRRSGQHKAQLVAALREDVRSCRKGGAGDRVDVLALLVDARYEDGQPMHEEDILDQLVTMLVGGFETSSNTLSWATYHLLANPDAEVAVREELARTFEEGRVDAQRCGELDLLEASIRESMRLNPIAIAAPRSLTTAQVFGSWSVPAGTIVWPCTYLAHRRPEVWPDPERFDPTRFLGGPSPKSNLYFPFGGGRRRCLGATFAQVEMRIVLARLIERCELELLSTNPAGKFRGIAIAPTDDLRLRLKSKTSRSCGAEAR